MKNKIHKNINIFNNTSNNRIKNKLKRKSQI